MRGLLEYVHKVFSPYEHLEEVGDSRRSPRIPTASIIQVSRARHISADVLGDVARLVTNPSAMELLRSPGWYWITPVKDDRMLLKRDNRYSI